MEGIYSPPPTNGGNMTVQTEAKKPTQDKKKYLRDKYREKVKGIFRFHEVPGGSMKFVYKEFKEDPVDFYEMKDGQIYEIPLGVAKHLNNNCWYPRHSYILNADGTPRMDVGKKINRCSFQSLQFTDESDMGFNQ